MTRLMKKFSTRAGMEPGAMVFVGDRKTEKTRIKVITYDEIRYEEKEVESIEACLPSRDSLALTWISVIGLHDTDVIERLGQHFNVHPLILADIAHTGHRPKIEETDQYVFVALKMIYTESPEGDVYTEQLNLVFGDRFVISFQERENRVFDQVRERLEKTVPRSRFLGADYLAYALVDAVVDQYFTILERLGEQIESVEDELVIRPGRESLTAIHDMKRQLILMRKRVWPLREVVGSLERTESKLTHDYTRVYVRDLYEHVIQVIDTIETFREMASGLLDIYLSSISNRMNEVMKMLTIIATIFIPLGFLAGVYGMNFNTEASPFNMPELNAKYGYVGFWLAAVAVGGGLLLFFRRKRWL